MLHEGEGDLVCCMEPIASFNARMKRERAKLVESAPFASDNMPSAPCNPQYCHKGRWCHAANRDCPGVPCTITAHVG